MSLVLTAITMLPTRRVLTFAAGCLLISNVALAVGPDHTAVPDRSLWPDTIDSEVAFDRASRAETLAFGSALLATEALDANALQQSLGVKRLDMETVRRIRARYWSRLFDNYRIALAHCVGQSAPFCTKAENLDEFKLLADEFAEASGPRYAAWQQDALRFHSVYLSELLRLAALFPRTSSEIDRFDGSELDGSELPDRQFLLTFDDGPTPADGNTDRTLQMLRREKLTATFFVLGDALQRRKDAPGTDIKALYTGMCVGTHGWQHKSHASWPEWQDSVIGSAALVKDSVGAAWRPLFRPPYGQRRADSAAFFEDQHLRIVLWGIDSQDWNQKMTAEAAQQRMLSLMLLWRHGVILFHDVHAKAHVAVPWIMKQVRNTGLTWVDCDRYPLPG